MGRQHSLGFGAISCHMVAELGLSYSGRSPVVFLAYIKERLPRKRVVALFPMFLSGRNGYTRDRPI